MSNKTSDKNVANIEEDVKILEEFAEICKAGLACYDQTREGKALEHILAEREQMIAERKKYTIHLTDEQYRKVIENAQMDTSKKLNESIPKQAIIDLIENETINISGFECVAIEDIQELLEGERK